MSWMTGRITFMVGFFRALCCTAMIILESGVSTFIPSVKGRLARVSQSLNDRMYRSQSGVFFQCGFFLFFRIHPVVSFLRSPTFCPHPRPEKGCAVCTQTAALHGELPA